MSDIYPTKLKKIIEEKGLTYNMIARMSGVTRAAISNYANGLRKPDIDTAGKIIRALQLNNDIIWTLFEPTYQAKFVHRTCQTGDFAFATFFGIFFAMYTVTYTIFEKSGKVAKKCPSDFGQNDTKCVHWVFASVSFQVVCHFATFFLNIFIL